MEVAGFQFEGFRMRDSSVYDFLSSIQNPAFGIQIHLIRVPTSAQHGEHTEPADQRGDVRLGDDGQGDEVGRARGVAREVAASEGVVVVERPGVGSEVNVESSARVVRPAPAS